MESNKTKHQAVKNPGGTNGISVNSPANNTGAINEFEDNLNVDWNDEKAGTSNATSVTNRLTNKSKGRQKQSSILSKILTFIFRWKYR
jgi:hypothetical protein